MCLMLVCHGVTYRVCADLSAKEKVTPRQVSEVTIASHTQRVRHKPGIMSEEMTIYVAAINATAATIGVGGGGTQQGSEEGKEPESTQGETKVHTPQTALHIPHFCLRALFH